MSDFVLSCTTCATRQPWHDEIEACFTHAPKAGYRAWGLAGPACWTPGDELPGGPLAGIAQLVEHLAHCGHQLRRGQIVLTGSPLPLWQVAAGDLIEVQCDQFGKRATARIDD